LQRSTVSPYLNLYRNDGSRLPNYQTLVRPQLQQQAVNQFQQQEIDRLQTKVARGDERQSLMPKTGHPSRFHYYSHFYARRGPVAK
jgi:hypothetical protein